VIKNLVCIMSTENVIQFQTPNIWSKFDRLQVPFWSHACTAWTKYVPPCVGSSKIPPLLQFIYSTVADQIAQCNTKLECTDLSGFVTIAQVLATQATMRPHLIGGKTLHYLFKLLYTTCKSQLWVYTQNVTIKQYGSNCLVGITEVWGFLH